MYMISQANNTTRIARIISQVIPVEVFLYACSLPPVAVIRSAFLKSIVDAFSIIYKVNNKVGFGLVTFESSFKASPNAIL